VRDRLAPCGRDRSAAVGAILGAGTLRRLPQQRDRPFAVALREVASDVGVVGHQPAD
jgi:hypothetical protein